MLVRLVAIISMIMKILLNDNLFILIALYYRELGSIKSGDYMVHVSTTTSIFKRESMRYLTTILVADPRGQTTHTKIKRVRLKIIYFN